MIKRANFIQFQLNNGPDHLLQSLNMPLLHPKGLDIALTFTEPYVDALLTVKYTENSNSGSIPSSPTKSTQVQLNVHRIVLARLSNYFLNEFKRLEAQNEANSENLVASDSKPELWTLTITFTGKKERKGYKLFPGLINFLYGKPLVANEVRKTRFQFLQNSTSLFALSNDLICRYDPLELAPI